MPTYQVAPGKKFGLLSEGEEVQLTEQEAAFHSTKLVRVADTRNDLHVEIDPSQKLIQSVKAEETDYTSLTVAELRGELETRGLSTVGNKAELVERLQEDDKSGD
jgi:hypothetical protein